VDQHQFCTSSADCSPLTGFYGITDDAAQNPILNPAQQAIFSLVRKAAWATKLDYIVNILHEQSLLANDYVLDRNVLSGPLPSNQWHAEVLNFHNISLAMLQRRVVEFASPQDVEVRAGVSALNYIVSPPTSELKSLCKAIKVRRPAYFNFSMFGLVMVLVLGLIIIVTEWCLQWAVDTAFKTSESNLKYYRRLEWKGSSVLQLQRLACEEHGVGPWVERNGVPRTQEEGKMFSVLSMVSKRDSRVLKELHQMLIEREHGQEHGDVEDLLFRYRMDRKGRPMV